jgi:hypothetical protein
LEVCLDARVCDPKCCVCSPRNVGPNDRSPRFEKRVTVAKLDHNGRVMTTDDSSADSSCIKVHGDGPSWGGGGGCCWDEMGGLCGTRGRGK